MTCDSRKVDVFILGGEGGRGSLRNGGNGTIEGSGAAGETSRGCGRLAPGDSQLPFAAPGSTPDCTMARIGNKYGAGGKGASGGRAGGGGGYSRAIVRVRPYEKITVSPGRGGQSNGLNGVCVASWGGPINPLVTGGGTDGGSSEESGSSSSGSHSRGSKSRGSKSRGGKSRGGKSRGGHSHGRKSHGSHSHGHKSHGKHSHGGKSRGGKSRGGKSRGGKSRGGHSHRRG